LFPGCQPGLGAEAPYFPILRVPLYICLLPLTHNNHIRRSNIWVRDLFLGVSYACPKGEQSKRSPILGVLLNLSLHTLTQNDQIRRSKTYGEGRVFKWTATPLHIAQNASRGMSAIAEFLFVCRLL